MSSNGRARSSGAPNRPSSRTGKTTTSNNSRSGISNNNVEKRQIVGQYMLGKTIGEGTFGKVKLAIHIPTGEKVAVKILEKSRIKEQADVRRVNREIKILKKARHGNIIQLYEVLDTPNTIYLIMECCEGGEMFDYIVAQKHVAEIQACKFFHQIIDGVEILHQNEITHRDLKPENLLLKASADGWLVKIVDFGLSNTHEGNRLLSTACGSPCYAAPEMIAGKKYCGPLADLWSIGVILFALVCGFLPFEDPNTSVLYKKILAGDYKPPKWISNDVRDLIACILEVDPRKRYTIADIRKHPWYTMVAESAIPREPVNVYENDQTRGETLAALTEAGMDAQAVMDGVISHACNPLTAMYYLLEQKHRTMRSRQAELQSQQAIKPSNSMPNRPIVVGDNPNSSNVAAKTPVSLAPIGQQQHQHQTAVVGTTNTHQSHLAANFAAQQSPKSHKSSTVPPTSGVPSNTSVHDPYKQTPPIMQQHHHKQQSNHVSQAVSSGGGSHLAPLVQQQNNVMPSLDVYMKTTLGAPGSAVPTEVMLEQKPILVPKLKLPAAGGSIKPATSEGQQQQAHRVNFRNVPGGSSNASPAGSSVMMSQTARVPHNDTLAAAIHIPNSAREAPTLNNNSTTTSQQRVITMINNLPVESDVPVQISEELLSMMPGGAAMNALGGEETGERPNTRRSHARSRGDGSEGARAAIAASIAFPQEAMGSLNLDDMMQLPLRDTESAGLADGQNKGPKVNDVNIVSSSVVTVVDQPIATTKPIISLNAQAPEMPPRSSSASGGRRGKNLTNGTVTGGPQNKMAVVAPTTTSEPTRTNVSIGRTTPTNSRPRIEHQVISKPPSAGKINNNSLNPRQQAIKNKLASQGTSIK